MVFGMERHTLWVSLLIFNTPLLAGKDFLTSDTLLMKPILCMENSVARGFKSHATARLSSRVF
jgi:hypothetical protein